MSTTYVIDMQDRPGALERLLNTCRRKRFEIDTLHFGHADVPGLRRVVVAFTEASPPAARIIPNLVRCHDVVAIEVPDVAAQPLPVSARVHAA